MLFSSITFLYFFLPIVLGLYFAVPFRFKNFILLIASLFFYFAGEPIYSILMVASSLSGWLHGLWIGKWKGQAKAKIPLISSIVFGLAGLLFFKYTDFFLDNINGIFGTSIGLLKLALPIGISFYTFQILSYTIDVYLGKAAVQKSFLDFTTYVAFFPQLIAGPIVRYTQIEAELASRTHSVENFALGARRFLVGLGKKVLIANVLGEVGNLFSQSTDKSVLFYWIAAMWEYYVHTGDIGFIHTSYPHMLTTMNFVTSRLDEDGLYTKRRGDWVFVDWTEFFDPDSGPLCAEQMLLCRAYDCMAKCSALVEDGKNAEKFTALKEKLYEKINALYWDEEKNAFIDDYRTGNRNVTRHANIFALLYQLTTPDRLQKIIRHVIQNPEIPAITTPYFEFFELDAMCGIGEFSYMTDMLRSYWGGMLEQGATTFWEEYFPEKSRVENYAMYGKAYGRSLCHAWGASPIYLLGKYALGVRPTAPAYQTYEVRPNLMCFGTFEGTVPAGNGLIRVKMDKESVTVLSDIEGGTLILGTQKYSIEKNIPLTIAIEN